MQGDTETMRHNEFNHPALRYLDQWLSKDSVFCDGLAAAQRPRRLNALRQAAAFYRVSRNLRREFDEDERLGPLLTIVDSLSRTDIEDRNPVGGVLKVRDRIREKYGDRGVLSLTTKILWLKFKTPLIIYDGQARTALAANDGDLADYYRRWRTGFQSAEREISLACRSLASVRDYCVDPSALTDNELQQLASQEWFKERVFDTYLWNRGTPSRQKSTPAQPRSVRGTKQSLLSSSR